MPREYTEVMTMIVEWRSIVPQARRLRARNEELTIDKWMRA